MNLEKALARVKVLEVQLSDTTSLLEKEIEAHTKAKEEILALQEKISALEAGSAETAEGIGTARLKVLIRNAIEYIAESSDSLGDIGIAQQREWYEDTLGITAEEMKNIGLDWFPE